MAKRVMRFLTKNELAAIANGGRGAITDLVTRKVVVPFDRGSAGRPLIGSGCATQQKFTVSSALAALVALELKANGGRKIYRAAAKTISETSEPATVRQFERGLTHFGLVTKNGLQLVPPSPGAVDVTLLHCQICEIIDNRL